MKSIKKIVTSILAVSLLSVFVSCKTGDDNNNAMLLAATANNSSNTNSDDTLTGTTYIYSFGSNSDLDFEVYNFINFSDYKFIAGHVTKSGSYKETVILEKGIYTVSPNGFTITVTSELDTTQQVGLHYVECNKTKDATFTDSTKTSIQYKMNSSFMMMTFTKVTNDIEEPAITLPDATYRAHYLTGVTEYDFVFKFSKNKFTAAFCINDISKTNLKGTYTATKSGYNITITSKATDDENFIDCNENITAPFTDATKNSIVFLGLVCSKKDLNDDNFPENSISSPEILTGEIYLYSVNFTWEGKNGTSTSILNFLENNFTCYIQHNNTYFPAHKGTYTKTEAGYEITVTSKLDSEEFSKGKTKWIDCNESTTATFTDDTKKSITYNYCTFTKK